MSRAASTSRASVATPRTRELVDALVVPYAAHLATPDGRDYLRIVAQLAPLFSTWREANPGTGPYLLEILGDPGAAPRAASGRVRRERVVEMIMLMTVALAERARLIESGEALELDEPTFAANLTDVLVGVLEAPTRSHHEGRSTGLVPAQVRDVRSVHDDDHREIAGRAAKTDQALARGVPTREHRRYYSRW